MYTYRLATYIVISVCLHNNFVYNCFYFKQGFHFCSLLRCHTHRTSKKNLSIGFFHPFSLAGGGGERVLWHAIKALQERYVTHSK